MRALSIIVFVFGLTGAAMLAGAGFWFHSNHRFMAQAARTEGTVVDLVDGRPVVRFTDHTGEAVEFKSPTSSNPPSFHVDEKVEVLYLRDRPRQAEINAFLPMWFGVLMLGGLGSLFFSIAAGMVIVPLLARRRGERLKRQGVPVFADFQGVELNTSFSVNDRHPYRVCAHWQDPATSNLHIFRSANLWFDPSGHIKVKKIKVFIDRKNPRKYHVDLSFLPKVIE